MRRIYQFDGLDGGVLSIGECTEPEQIIIHLERNGQRTDMRLGRSDWYNIVDLGYKVNFIEKEEAEQKLAVVK
jgi:hypothetical protein